MMTLTEKVAYLKGLTEGLKLNENEDSTKIFKAIMDVLEDMALTVSDIDDELELVCDQLDAVDDDLSAVEEIVYDDDDCCCDCDDDMFEVECPACGETVYFEDSALDEDFVNCPACGEKLEFDFDCCDCDDCSDEDK